MIIFKIKGVVKEKESGTALPGLLIKAYDKDLFFDDLLGSAVSDARGTFEIVSEIEDFREFFETRPDIYFKVYRGDLSRPVHSTEDAVRWNAGRITDIEILIPGDELHELSETEIVLTGDDGERREEFEVGESLTISTGGLRPSHAYDIEIHLDGDQLFTSRVLTNLRGEIEPTVLWPQMGFDDPRSDARYTPDEARQRWKGKKLRLVVASGKERLAEQSFRIADVFTRPLVLATDREGRLLNGFEVGSQPLHVTVSQLPFGGPEGKMQDHLSAPGLDPKSPHDTKGLRLRWDNSGDRLVYDIPAADKDVTGFAALSFRIAQTVDSMHNTASQSQNLRVALKDAANNERAVRVSAFTEVPFPDHRANHANSKSAMNTVRIPLKSYTIVCAGQPQVDLQNVVSLSFVFSEKPTGEVEIDEVAFSN